VLAAAVEDLVPQQQVAAVAAVAAGQAAAGVRS
jgi:hypothetical protein